jgi:hypothetical protein
MISEKKFINGYGFFWGSILPMSKVFLRKMNKDLLLSTNDYYLDSATDGRRRSFISLLGFNLFANSIGINNYLQLIKQNGIEEVENLTRNQLKNYEFQEIGLLSKLTEIEINEAIELAIRMRKFFIKYESNSQINISPFFKGCGFIENCFGDVIVNNTLYELKAVQRNFQVVDYKQLITYCALNYMSRQYDIKEIALYNPRSGNYFKHNIDQFSMMISGKPSTILFGEVIEFISGGGISK